MPLGDYVDGTKKCRLADGWMSTAWTVFMWLGVSGTYWIERTSRRWAPGGASRRSAVEVVLAEDTGREGAESIEFHV
jgi:hypothetical protein